jgi:hypothetical protein
VRLTYGRRSSTHLDGLNGRDRLSRAFSHFPGVSTDRCVKSRVRHWVRGSAQTQLSPELDLLCEEKLPWEDGFACIAVATA